MVKKPFLFLGVVAALVAATFLLYRLKTQPTQTASLSDKPILRERNSQPMSAPSLAPSLAPGGPVALSSLSEETKAALHTLDEILASRNDNDPRLDTQFRNLSAETKAALKQKYSQLPMEDRNGRGTIVFLLGREIKSASDLEFFQEVMNEPPCLSLADCTKDTPAHRGSDGHSELGVETTLAYPQLVDLVSLDNRLSNSDPMDSAMRERAWKIIQAGKASPVPPVARKAAELEQRFRH